MKTCYRTITTRTLIALVAACLIFGRESISVPATEISPMAGPVTFVSIAPGHGNANGESDGQALSADGRFAAFASFATNLLPGETNEVRQLYVRDTLLGTLERVSVSSSGESANNYSFGQDVSSDGRFVLMSSAGWNLVPDDNNGRFDLFVRDRLEGLTKRVSLDESGLEIPDGSITGALSDDGRLVAFLAPTPGNVGSPVRLYLRDLSVEQTKLVAEIPNVQEPRAIQGPRLGLSGDGRWLAFSSDAPVADGDSAELRTFLHDNETGALKALPTPPGIPGEARIVPCAISTDGRWLLVVAGSAILSPDDPATAAAPYLYDRVEGAYLSIPVPLRPGGHPNPVYDGVMSGDGRFVAFIADLPVEDSDIIGGPSEAQDLVIFNRDTGELSRPVSDFRGRPLLRHPLPGAQSATPPLPAAFSEDGSVLLFSAGQNYIHPADQNGHLDAFLFRFEAEPLLLHHRAVVPAIVFGEPLIIFD